MNQYLCTYSYLHHLVTATEPIVFQHAVTTVKKKKSKVIPLQSRTGPEVSRRLRLPDFKTFGT